MFTGIIESTGKITQIKPESGDYRLSVEVGKLSMQDVQLGDSIAVNGVCLTVIEFGASYFVADVSTETVEVTGFRHYKSGQIVNLEKAMLPTTRMGGHLVSGHVDGIGKIIERFDSARSVRFVIEAPKDIQHYIAAKGSITVDGVSLTVNKIDRNRFELNIVPHTLEETSMNNFKVGTQVNLEIDIIARYVERLLNGQADTGAKSQPVTLASLAQAGFLK
jgi:riboflavin synthase